LAFIEYIIFYFLRSRNFYMLVEISVIMQGFI